MLKRLVELSLIHRGIVLALAAGFVLFGLYTASRARLDVFPEFAPPQVTINTEAPGFAPEQVEALVTRPVENAVNGVSGLQSLRSQSIQGLSSVVAVFDSRTDIFRARQLVAERLGEAASALPQQAHAPIVAPLTSSASVVLVVGLTSGERAPMDVRSFADWVLKPRLLGVPGVAKIATFGGEVRQIQVQLRPDRLLAFGLGTNDVLDAARNATGIRGAGFVEGDNQRVLLLAEGQPVTASEIGDVVVARHGGASVLLRDVARVVEAPEPKLGDASIGGEPGVVLVVSSQFGANTVEVTRSLESALREMAPAFRAEHLLLHPALFRPASFVAESMGNVRFALLLGGLLVAVVLFLFLYNIRAAFVSFTAIPLSLLAAVIVLDRLGLSLNVMTLGGLAIAIGVVVDDAIIDVENIARRLRQNEAEASPAPALGVVRDASLEVRGAVVYATYVVALVFLPVLALSGLQGRLFAPLGIAYIAAILASLIVALTVTPALMFVLLKGRAVGRTEGPLLVRLREGYGRLLARAMERPRSLIIIAVILCVAAAATLPFFGGALLPELRESHFIIHMSAVPGTSIQESLRLGKAVSLELMKNRHILSVAQRVGRAEQGDDTWGSHYSEFDVELKPLGGEEAEGVQAELRSAVAKFPGANFAIKPFLTERVEETISGATAQVAVSIFGDSLDALDDKAAEVARVLSGVPGAADVQVQAQPGTPELVVRVHPERLSRLGLTPVEVFEALQTAYQGAVVAQTYSANRVVDVAVILDPALRRDPESVGDLLLRTRDGAVVPLRTLADVFLTSGRYVVMHEGTRRRQAVTCNVQGRDLASFVGEARRSVTREVRFPSGTYADFTGAAQAREQTQRELLVNSALAGLGIVLLLSLVFRNAANLILVLANIPFALVGGVLAAFITGGELSIGSMVGFVTLFGITMRNSMMLVSHFEHLVSKEGMTWGKAAAFRGATERFSPIVMTALVTGLGLVPLALGRNAPGREIEGPMAVVILGGLITSTALNLFVLPSLVVRFGRFSAGASDE
ncbi:MAG TPA: efflux RND transporter permease subunit [Candidatus Nitrosotalea sp.]|nr:efflux RND transporter permease subunit [Candidatus Nitrosotalea sp.]